MIEWWSSLSGESQTAILGALLAAVVGGALSLAGSLLALLVTQRNDRIRKERDRREDHAWSAFIGSQKLMNDWNALENLARHLDGEFQTASKYGGLEDPGLFVRQIVGAQHEVDFLSQNEMRFLLGGSNDLVYEISEIQRRIKNDLHFVTVFNDLKKDCERFVMSCPEIKLEVDGDSAAGQFSGLNTQRAKMKIGTMNMLISDVITSLEEDRPRISAIVQEFVRLGRETYGSDFPAKKVEKRMPEPC